MARKLGRFQIDLWEERARYGDLRSVLDPNDKKGLRNIYIDLMEKAILSNVLVFSPEDNILDFGCGIGRLTYWIAPHVLSITGLDVNHKSIDIAESHQHKGKTNIRFVTYDGVNLPFDNASFDKVVSNWVLQHILKQEDFQAIIKGICRVTKSGGKIYFIETIAKKKTIPRDFAEDYVIFRPKELYIHEFESNGCRLLLDQIITARTRGFFYKLISKKQAPTFLEPLIPFLIRLDLLQTHNKEIPDNSVADYLFIFER